MAWEDWLSIQHSMELSGFKISNDDLREIESQYEALELDAAVENLLAEAESSGSNLDKVIERITAIIRENVK
jgi:Glu-tRNA(Gln) amidotransferase subunit E-like FAD-binding protein